MTAPQAHRVYLDRRGYTPRLAGELSPEEMDILDRRGHWLEALATGAIQPITKQQEHFLRVARGEAAPETEYERVWVKVASPPAPAEVLLGVPAQRRAPAVQPAPPAPEDRLEELAVAKGRAEAIRRRMEAEREAILEAVRAQLAEVDAKYAAELQQADAEVSELESAVKDTVLALGQSARLGDIQAVYYRGRVTWDTQGLEDYAEAHPEVRLFRKVGKPSVSLRYRPTS